MTDRKAPRSQAGKRQVRTAGNRGLQVRDPVPRSAQRLLRIFYLALAALLVAGLVVPGHPHFSWEKWPGFYAVYGFVACVVLVLVAKYILRPLVRRNEDYYD